MKRIIFVIFILLLTVSFTFAAGPKTYQVTGPVLEVTKDTVVVQKGKEKWEIALDASTKVKGELKVGAKVTIEYTMKGAAVEVKKLATKLRKRKVNP